MTAPSLPVPGATVVIVGETCYAGRIGAVVRVIPDPRTVMVELIDRDRPTARTIVLPFGASEVIVTIDPAAMRSGQIRA